MLRDLAAHPATAHHVATKLVRHFAADTPPASAVDRVAQAFIESDGNLPTVYEALVASPEAWGPQAHKLKTPRDYVVSACRALDFLPEREQMVKSLQQLGQPAYTPGSPAGWPDTEAHWGGSGALMQRIEWANAIAERTGDKVDPMSLAESALGPTLSGHTATALARASSAAQGITLLLVSPEFQRR